MQLKALEILAPAKDLSIGIAAIDCGADAVYMAGPGFGARVAAANSMEDVAEMVRYAHRFGARVYLTLNTIIYEEELPRARQILFQARDAGVDAVIVQDLGLLEDWPEGLEFHASTQCNIRTPEQARWIESLGATRIVLARELSLAQIRAIRETVSCEIECFIHGALCVCYSGQCYLSQHLAGRSANRGACIQACRSLYDLTDTEGRLIAGQKPLLSLKDLRLGERIEELADAGVVSFKIEGRLKNISYVKNVVRYYRAVLDEIISRRSGEYRHSSLGEMEGGFTPKLDATFSRGDTEFFLDGTRASWLSGQAAKSMGEYIGTVRSAGKSSSDNMVITLNSGIPIRNGDGLSFVCSPSNIIGMRADVVKGVLITLKHNPDVVPGTPVYRNYNIEFERELERNMPRRLIPVEVNVEEGGIRFGNQVFVPWSGEDPIAENQQRAREIFADALGRRTDNYFCKVGSITDAPLPHLSVGAINTLRREAVSRLKVPMEAPRDMVNGRKEALIAPKQQTQLNIANSRSAALYKSLGIDTPKALELDPSAKVELARCRYCLRHELDLCPKQGKEKRADDLLLHNGGRSLRLHFDCKNCEMVILTQSPL
ncbi:MAG: U32 family peptidase [Bacteroidales bacterium]|nr:U32 family peptidase [Bacteroidales bacterium]